MTSFHFTINEPITYEVKGGCCSGKIVNNRVVWFGHHGHRVCLFFLNGVGNSRLYMKSKVFSNFFSPNLVTEEMLRRRETAREVQ